MKSRRGTLRLLLIKNSDENGSDNEPYFSGEKEPFVVKRRRIFQARSLKK